MPNLTYENLADANQGQSNNQGGEQVEQRGAVRRFFGGVRSALSSAFGWCNDRDEDELQNLEQASRDVLQRFMV